jgi:hypothetical protein
VEGTRRDFIGLAGFVLSVSPDGLDGLFSFTSGLSFGTQKDPTAVEPAAHFASAGDPASKLTATRQKAIVILSIASLLRGAARQQLLGGELLD